MHTDGQKENKVSSESGLTLSLPELYSNVFVIYFVCHGMSQIKVLRTFECTLPCYSDFIYVVINASVHA